MAKYLLNNFLLANCICICFTIEQIYTYWGSKKQLPFSAETWLYMNCSLNENAGTRSTPKRNASLMKPLRLFKYSFTSSFAQLRASKAPPGTRTVAIPFGLLILKYP